MTFFIHLVRYKFNPFMPQFLYSIQYWPQLNWLINIKTTGWNVHYLEGKQRIIDLLENRSVLITHAILFTFT